MRTLCIEIGGCGWGAACGLVPEVRLGWLRIWVTRGSVIKSLAAMRIALAEAVAELKGERK